jgi:hypothetical protein
MDYADVPKGVLKLAVKVSKAARAEYWACDIAVGKDGKFRVLECATAFAAFPYIRDWIGQYIMWKFGNGMFKKPHIPMYNWEELGKINSSLLRTMRYVTFGRYTPSFDGEHFITKENEVGFEMNDTVHYKGEEWPSEVWNFQDNLSLKKLKTIEEKRKSKEEDSESESSGNLIEVGEKELKKILKEAKGVGKKMSEKIVDEFGSAKLTNVLENEPEVLKKIKGLKTKKINAILEKWKEFKEKYIN